MSSSQAQKDPEVRKENLPTRPVDRPVGERERLRDILVVFVTYPITPTKRTEEVAESKPWLEFLSLLLKVALAAYALYEGIMDSGSG